MNIWLSSNFKYLINNFIDLLKLLNENAFSINVIINSFRQNILAFQTKQNIFWLTYDVLSC